MLGVGEGATFPVATRAMQAWTAPGRRGFAQGITHAFARLGNAMTPPIVAWLIGLVTWRGSFVPLGCLSLRLGRGVGLVLPRCPVGASARSPPPNSSKLPNRGGRRPARRTFGRGHRTVASARRTHVAGCGRLLLLRVDAVDVPELAAVVLPARAQPPAQPIGAVLVGGVLGRRWRRLSWRRHQRRDPATDR